MGGVYPWLKNFNDESFCKLWAGPLSLQQFLLERRAALQ
jgi:hypothetical protein